MIAPASIAGNLLVRRRMGYSFAMPRSVHYRIHDRADGLFDAVATLAPDKTYRRAGFASLAAAEAWIDGLRTLMAAIGAPLVQAPPGQSRPEAEILGIDGTRFDRETAVVRLRRFRDALAAAGEDEAG